MTDQEIKKSILDNTKDKSFDDISNWWIPLDKDTKEDHEWVFGEEINNGDEEMIGAYIKLFNSLYGPELVLTNPLALNLSAYPLTEGHLWKSFWNNLSSDLKTILTPILELTKTDNSLLKLIVNWPSNYSNKVDNPEEPQDNKTSDKLKEVFSLFYNPILLEAKPDAKGLIGGEIMNRLNQLITNLNKITNNSENPEINNTIIEEIKKEYYYFKNGLLFDTPPYLRDLIESIHKSLVLYTTDDIKNYKSGDIINKLTKWVNSLKNSSEYFTNTITLNNEIVQTPQVLMPEEKPLTKLEENYPEIEQAKKTEILERTEDALLNITPLETRVTQLAQVVPSVNETRVITNLASSIQSVDIEQTNVQLSNTKNYSNETIVKAVREVNNKLKETNSVIEKNSFVNNLENTVSENTTTNTILEKSPKPITKNYDQEINLILSKFDEDEQLENLKDVLESSWPSTITPLF